MWLPDLRKMEKETLSGKSADKKSEGDVEAAPLMNASEPDDVQRI